MEPVEKAAGTSPDSKSALWCSAMATDHTVSAPTEKPALPSVRKSTRSPRWRRGLQLPLAERVAFHLREAGHVSTTAAPVSPATAVVIRAVLGRRPG